MALPPSAIPTVSPRMTSVVAIHALLLLLWLLLLMMPPKILVAAAP